MESNKNSIDEERYQLALQEAKAKLERCQEERHLQSCLSCEKLIGCEVRNHYVDKVYESMNKGQGGGFEF